MKRLEAAGAIVIGKTNAPEFGSTAITKNLVYGVTRSPWDLALTPGGSSGGSAAALAACVCPLVTASDGGGSIRIPASFVGAFGLKASFGRIPRGPFAQWEFDDKAVSGPLTKTVADAALVLDVTAGPSPCDPNSLPAPGLSYVAALAEALPAGTRFGFSADLGYAVVQSDVAAVVEDAARVFEKLGHRLLPIAAARRSSAASGGCSAASSCARSSRRSCPSGAARSAARCSGASSSRSTSTRAPGARWRGSARSSTTGARALFEQVDFLLTPTVPYDPPPAKGPFPRETEGRRQRPAGVASFTIPFNWSWHPAATLRAGLSRRGLPVGLQIVGPRHRDDLVLRASLAFERERPAHPHWPTTLGEARWLARSRSTAHATRASRACAKRSRRTSARATRWARRWRSLSTDELVVDLWGGHHDRARTRPWQRDTLVNVYSTTKGVTALCAHRLVDEGRLDLDAPVAKYWPEFAQAGKGAIPVRWLLSHRAGLPAVRKLLPNEALYDWDAMTAALAAETPWWEPGRAHGYHAVTFGWLVGEVVRRIAGKSLGAYLREEFAEPLGLDFHIGLAESEHARVADILQQVPPDPDGEARPALRALAQRSGGRDGARLPEPAEHGPGSNVPAWRSAEIPGANGHGTARALATLYGRAALGDGVGARAGRDRALPRASSRTGPTWCWA